MTQTHFIAFAPSLPDINGGSHMSSGGQPRGGDPFQGRVHQKSLMATSAYRITAMSSWRSSLRRVNTPCPRCAPWQVGSAMQLVASDQHVEQSCVPSSSSSRRRVVLWCTLWPSSARLTSGLPRSWYNCYETWSRTLG